MALVCIGDKILQSLDIKDSICSWWIPLFSQYYIETMPGGVHVARLNFKTSHDGVYICLSLIAGFAVTVAIWPREVVSCRDFILRAVTTFWAMSLIGIYPGRASTFHLPTNLPPPLQSMLHTTSG